MTKPVIDRILEEDWVTAEDGYVLWFPREGKGGLTAYQLRLIANELDRRNDEWDMQVRRGMGEAIRARAEEVAKK